MKVNPPPQKKELCAAIVHFIYENQIVGHVYKFSFKCPYFSKSCLNRFPHSSGCYVFCLFIVSIITTSKVKLHQPLSMRYLTCGKSLGHKIFLASLIPLGHVFPSRITLMYIVQIHI
jgi:hypothetical protein